MAIFRVLEVRFRTNLDQNWAKKMTGNDQTTPKTHRNSEITSVNMLICYWPQNSAVSVSQTYSPPFSLICALCVGELNHQISTMQ